MERNGVQWTAAVDGGETEHCSYDSQSRPKWCDALMCCNIVCSSLVVSLQLWTMNGTRRIEWLDGMNECSAEWTEGGGFADLYSINLYLIFAQLAVEPTEYHLLKRANSWLIQQYVLSSISKSSSLMEPTKVSRNCYVSCCVHISVPIHSLTTLTYILSFPAPSSLSLLEWVAPLPRRFPQSWLPTKSSWKITSPLI